VGPTGAPARSFSFFFFGPGGGRGAGIPGFFFFFQPHGAVGPQAFFSGPWAGELGGGAGGLAAPRPPPVLSGGASPGGRWRGGGFFFAGQPPTQKKQHTDTIQFFVNWGAGGGGWARGKDFRFFGGALSRGKKFCFAFCRDLGGKKGGGPGLGGPWRVAPFSGPKTGQKIQVQGPKGGREGGPGGGGGVLKTF